MVRKVLVTAALAVLGLGAYQPAWADDDGDPVPDDANSVAVCAPAEGGRPLACLSLDRQTGRVRAAVVCVREPQRQGPPLVSPKPVCVESEALVEPVREILRSADPVVCSSGPVCTDYDKNEAGAVGVADFAEDRLLGLLNDSL